MIHTLPGIHHCTQGEIAAFQNVLLREHVCYAVNNSIFYKERFAAAGIDSRQIKCVADLASVPFTSKQDVEKAGDDLACVGEENFQDICLTSGTTGLPVAMKQTASDLKRLALNEEGAFRLAGLTCKDRVMIAAAMDRCFMAGLAYFLGLNRIGATALRAGSSSLAVMTDQVLAHRPTAIVGVPTLMLALGQRVLESGHNPFELGVEKLICIGEPVRSSDFSYSALGQRIADLWGSKVFGTYASTEMASTFCECGSGMGGHMQPELIVVEIVDEKGRVLPPGNEGEVVATPLQVTGMPLLRYRTGDVAVMYSEKCACGRTSPRLGPILGRKSQLLKYRGTSVYPPAIFAVLQEMKEIQGYFIEVRDHFELSDQIKVVVGSVDPVLTPAGIADLISARIRVKPEVEIWEPDLVAGRIRQEGKRKPVLFFDFRAGGND